MDYEDRNWFNLDMIWFKAVKKLPLIQQERVRGWLPLEIRRLALLSQTA